ncbi:unnamed protein product [Camellia sinensis]
MDQENAAHLQQGVGLLLSAWTALQMAFENDCGGPDSPQKFQQLASDIFSSLNQSKVMGNDDDSIGNNDSEVDTSEFQSNVEDGRIVVASRQSRGRRN